VRAVIASAVAQQDWRRRLADLDEFGLLAELAGDTFDFTRHLDAGADHIAIQLLTGPDADVLAVGRPLAAALNL